MTADAATIVQALQDVGWPVGRTAPWGVDGLEVDDTTYVNSIDTHVDGDYEHWYLVEVCDRDRDAKEHLLHGPELVPSETGETWVELPRGLHRAHR